MTNQDPCPHCGRPRGYLMQTHPDMPGLVDRLRGAMGQPDRWLVTAMLSSVATLALAAANSLFHVV